MKDQGEQLKLETCCVTRQYILKVTRMFRLKQQMLESKRLVEKDFEIDWSW